MEKTLFLHPPEDYDFQVHLHPIALPRYVQNVAADETLWTKRSKYVNVADHGAGKDSTGALLDFDPAIEFARDLQVSELCYNKPGLNVGCLANIRRYDRVVLRPFWGHCHCWVLESTRPTSKALSCYVGLFYGSCAWEVCKGV